MPAPLKHPAELPPGEAAVDDWHTLFQAVCERLRLAAADVGGAGLLRTQVLDAVQALEQLQLSLRQDFELRVRGHAEGR